MYYTWYLVGVIVGGISLFIIVWFLLFEGIEVIRINYIIVLVVLGDRLGLEKF